MLQNFSWSEVSSGDQIERSMIQRSTWEIFHSLGKETSQETSQVCPFVSTPFEGQHHRINPTNLRLPCVTWRCPNPPEPWVCCRAPMRPRLDDTEVKYRVLSCSQLLGLRCFLGVFNVYGFYNSSSRSGCYETNTFNISSGTYGTLQFIAGFSPRYSANEMSSLQFEVCRNSILNPKSNTHRSNHSLWHLARLLVNMKGMKGWETLYFQVSIASEGSITQMNQGKFRTGGYEWYDEDECDLTKHCTAAS